MSTARPRSGSAGRRRSQRPGSRPWWGPVDRLDRPIAGVYSQTVVDVALEHRNLAVIGLDEVAQRLDADRVRLTKCHLVELRVAGPAEHVYDRGQHTLFGHHRVHLRLQTRPQRDQLRSITDQLTQLPC